MLIYEYNPINDYFTGKVEEIADDAGIPMCWTNEPVPEIPSGFFARYNNPGWVLTEMEPPFPLPPPEPEAPPSGEAPEVL